MDYEDAMLLAISFQLEHEELEKEREALGPGTGRKRVSTERTVFRPRKA